MNKTKNAPVLLCPEFGKDNPYKGKESAFQKATATFLSYFNLFNRRAFHVPNGGQRVMRRNKKGEFYNDGANLKREGVKSGVSDWLILIPFELVAVKYCGMAIELKVKGGTIEESQIEFLNEMYSDGYFCAICWNMGSFEEIIKKAYL